MNRNVENPSEPVEVIDQNTLSAEQARASVDAETTKELKAMHVEIELDGPVDQIANTAEQVNPKHWGFEKSASS